MEVNRPWVTKDRSSHFLIMIDIQEILPGGNW